MTKFTKGDKATLLGSWDNKGTVFFRDVIVHSCGRKQMVLTSEATGEELGRHFAPVVGTLDDVTGFHWQATFPRMTEQQAVDACLIAGAKVVEYNRERLNNLIENSRARSADPGYIRCLEKDLAALHEPRSMNRSAE